MAVFANSARITSIFFSCTRSRRIKSRPSSSKHSIAQSARVSSAPMEPRRLLKIRFPFGSRNCQPVRSLNSEQHFRKFSRAASEPQYHRNHYAFFARYGGFRRLQRSLRPIPKLQRAWFRDLGFDSSDMRSLGAPPPGRRDGKLGGIVLFSSVKRGKHSSQRSSDEWSNVF